MRYGGGAITVSLRLTRYSSDLAGRVAKADMQGERGPNSLSLDIFRWDSVRCLAGDCPKDPPRVVGTDDQTVKERKQIRRRSRPGAVAFIVSIVCATTPSIFSGESTTSQIARSPQSSTLSSWNVKHLSCIGDVHELSIGHSSRMVDS